MNVLKKIIACIFVCAIFFGAGYILSNFQSSRKHSVDLAKYEARLVDITKLNRDIQDENKRVTELNTIITDRNTIIEGKLNSVTIRLDSAKSIINGLDGQTTDDGNTTQRLVDNVSRLEQALSIIFTGR